MADFIEVSGKLDQLISQVKRGLNAELKYYTSELGEPMPPEPYVDAPVFEEYDEERLLEELETGDIVELVEQRQKAAGKLLVPIPHACTFHTQHVPRACVQCITHMHVHAHI